jgi:uncharacterized protein (DUF885 family)
MTTNDAGTRVIRAMHKFALVLVATVSTISFGPSARAQDSLEKLASDYWTWRVQYQPYNSDDVPRIERPTGQKHSWSAASIAHQREELAAFTARLRKLDPASFPVAQQVDYQLLKSSTARVHWELDLNRRWQRDPTFYLDQSVTPFLAVLLPPPPFDEARSRELILRLDNVSSILDEGKANLTDPAAPFAKLAIDSLRDVRPDLQIVARDVTPFVAGPSREQLIPAIERATAALESYRAWVQDRLPRMTERATAGREAYVYFLQNVALYPFSPEQLLQMSRQEWARAVVSEEFERERNRGIAPLTVPATSAEQVQRTADAEAEIRLFLSSHKILTLPASFPHYTVRPVPAYLAPLGDFGELDDFTGPSRLDQDCTRWIPTPSDKLGYFDKAAASDPRTILVHEGVPGHYTQLWLSWRNPDPIRRHYYDSGANEGLGFYSEEMMLRAGLFDNSPHTREIIYSFMRLRALRVEVDVKLALGDYTIEQGARYLAEMVPMDSHTALSEAAFFATQPGLAIAYLTGKTQITDFLAEARFRAGDSFDINAFNDSLWQNGNVPIALQRLEWFASHSLGIESGH